MSKVLRSTVFILHRKSRLLDDIQRLNIHTLKWEPVATLLNPLAASYVGIPLYYIAISFISSGMTMENDRIYLV